MWERIRAGRGVVPPGDMLGKGRWIYSAMSPPISMPRPSLVSSHPLGSTQIAGADSSRPMGTIVHRVGSMNSVYSSVSRDGLWPGRMQRRLHLHHCAHRAAKDRIGLYTNLLRIFTHCILIKKYTEWFS